MAKQYQIEYYCEGAIGTIFLGASSLPIERMQSAMNARSAQGWDVHFVVTEQRRMFLFWKRETAVVIYSKGS